jgi:lipopolysaccharide/colanic/teichoic acid biosynthesis glycosyltransferase
MGEADTGGLLGGRERCRDGGRSARVSTQVLIPTGEALRRRERGTYEFGKRAVDIVLSALVLIVCLPLCLAVAVAIRLESRGSVLFVQKRVGRNGQPFAMLKFRSMVRDAQTRRKRIGKENAVGGPVFKVRADSRVTRVGRVLRRTSIDELPQFLNVLKGDMSLVGPRPLPVSDIGHHGPLPPGITEDVIDTWIRTRQTVRPGITGLWQVNGRSLLPLEGWIRYDTEYVTQSGPLLDTKTLLLTPLVVLTGRGAF